MELLYGLTGVLLGVLFSMVIIKKLLEKMTLKELHATQLQQALQEATIALEQTKKELELVARHHEEKLSLLQATKAQIEKDFKAITGELYESRSEAFAKRQKIELETLLNPFKEQIKSFEKRVEESYNQEAKERALLGKELSQLQQLNMQMRQDAINLTNALKGENKTQGNWGEVILERLLEDSGLHKGREYAVQTSFTNENGKRLMPDVVVHLPDKKDIVIDAKVSLVAYERYTSSDNPMAKEQAMREHIASIKAHIEGLSKKSYEDLTGVNTLDFVLLFMPIEGAFLAALEHDGHFFAQAFEKNIMVVSPSTLMVTLRTIANIWRYEHQSHNAVLIATKAGALYDKFVGFVEDIKKIGEQIGRTEQTYQAALGKLQSGKGNLVTRTEELKLLGVKAKKELGSSISIEALEHLRDEEF